MDLFNNTEIVTPLLRIFLVIILCGMIGLEREIKKQAAGLRTHILVGLGACLLMLLSLDGFSNFITTYPNVTTIDPSRIPSYVITGIGFLGAGTIIVQGGGTQIRGLTTAASIWIVAGIGLVVGNGMYFEAIVTTLLVLFVLFFLNKLEATFFHKNKSNFILTLNVKQPFSFTTLSNTIENNGGSIVKTTSEAGENSNMTFQFFIQHTNDQKKKAIVDSLLQLDNIKKVTTQLNEETPQ
ncbi:MgtC/SapB family protein [Bacillus suaedae]|uniref:MgtC/SapB family protein n=1 Tax=Halalkalibacter suaedae TaxID=2822140 RepID=A0A940WYC6_9BACI|nr:MgtC/SapB family protein [Bacillus suaedae]MBP3950274.1 MgtC/SapB family protein [Bacillus suaedae]